MEGLWNFCREKLLHVQSLVKYSLRDWKMRMLRAVYMIEARLACEVSERSKSLLSHLCEETLVSGQLDLKTQL